MPLAPAALRSLLQQGLDSLRLPLPATAIDQMLQYVAELEKWNSAYNLTAVRDPKQMVLRHLLDSLAALPLAERELAHGSEPTVLDVGAGAGLPCIPWAIARPHWRVTGLDSNGKKTRFMRHAGRTLGLTQFSVIEGRVEEIPPDARFSLVTSRAFASLGDFFGLTRHLLADNGRWLALKAHLTPAELAESPSDLTVYPAERIAVPGVPEARHVVIAHP